MTYKWHDFYIFIKHKIFNFCCSFYDRKIYRKNRNKKKNLIDFKITRNYILYRIDYNYLYTFLIGIKIGIGIKKLYLI